MAQQAINTNGLDPAGTGSDTARTAFDKTNANFTELYAGMARADAFALLPGMRNLLINGDFSINQRAFAGGALAAGVYGFDRWKAGSGGCSVTVNGTTGVVTHVSGPLVQVIEAPRIAGQAVTVSVEDPSGSITVNVDGVTGTITAGVGRRGVTLTVPAGSTGNVTLTLTATNVSYRRVMMEMGSRATGWDARPVALEALLCDRYFQVFTINRGPLFLSYTANTDTRGRIFYPTPMRAAPSVGFSATTWSVLGFGNGTSVTNITITVGLGAADPEGLSIIVSVNSALQAAGSHVVWASSTPVTIKLEAEL